MSSSGEEYYDAVERLGTAGSSAVVPSEDICVAVLESAALHGWATGTLHAQARTAGGQAVAGVLELVVAVAAEPVEEVSPAEIPVGAKAQIPCETVLLQAHTKRLPDDDIEDDFFSLASFTSKQPARRHRLKKKRRKDHDGGTSPVPSQPAPPLGSFGNAIVLDSDDDLPPIGALQATPEDATPVAETAPPITETVLPTLRTDLSSTAPTHTTTKTPSHREAERTRVYVFRVRSMIPGLVGTEVLLAANGATKFEVVVARCVQLVTEAHDSGVVDLSDHTPSDAVLVWIDHQMELKLYFRPLTLGIPPPPLPNKGELEVYLEVKCLLIRKKDLLMVREWCVAAGPLDGKYTQLLRDISSLLAQSQHQGEPEEEDTQVDLLVAEADLSVEQVVGIDRFPPSLAPKAAPPATQPLQQGGMRLVLRGADNQRVAVTVSATTPLLRLVSHFRELQGLGVSVRIVLKFDDEALDPQDTVGSTELEDEDTVDVVVG